MTKRDVVVLLEENQNERGIANWQKREADAARLQSYGIGLTVLRKLAKKIGQISYGDDNNCEPLNLLKHMKSDYLKKKFGA